MVNYIIDTAEYIKKKSFGDITMRKKYMKLWLFVVVLLSSIVFTGCDDGGQEALKLDVNEPFEALRVGLQSKNQSNFITPHANKIVFTPLNVSLQKDSNSTNIRAADFYWTETNEERQVYEPINFKDLDNRTWTLKIPNNGITFKSSTEATIIAKVDFSEGGQKGLDITFYMIKEGTGVVSEWVINDIFVEEVLATVATGLEGRVTDDSGEGVVGIEGARVAAYQLPYYENDRPVATTSTNGDGYYELFLEPGEYQVMIWHADYKLKIIEKVTIE